MAIDLENSNYLGTVEAKIAVETAARTITGSQRALGLIHSAFDDARQKGLPPHHAITTALDKLGRGQ